MSIELLLGRTDKVCSADTLRGYEVKHHVGDIIECMVTKIDLRVVCDYACQ